MREGHSEREFPYNLRGFNFGTEMSGIDSVKHPAIMDGKKDIKAVAASLRHRLHLNIFQSTFLDTLHFIVTLQCH